MILKGIEYDIFGKPSRYYVIIDKKEVILSEKEYNQRRVKNEN